MVEMQSTKGRSANMLYPSIRFTGNVYPLHRSYTRDKILVSFPPSNNVGKLVFWFPGKSHQKRLRARRAVGMVNYRRSPLKWQGGQCDMY